MPLPAAGILFMAALCGAGPVPASPETAAVMRAVYLDETLAQARYEAFDRKALAEGYPRIAYFFRAAAASEAVHARNAKDILARLGSPAAEGPAPVVPDAPTKKNLEAAIAGEIRIIEGIRPAYLKRIAPERRADAISSLQAELEVEREHLSMLKKIARATGLFFGTVVKRFEQTPVEYHVCLSCGEIYFEAPKSACPVCKAPVSRYLAVPGKP